jgi:anti-anti-sigma factor
MPPLEEITFEVRGDTVVARIKGEVDLSNEASVKERLFASVPNSAAALVLDLSETDYMDSSGVRLVFELAHRLQARGQKLDLVVPDDSAVNRLLVLTEMERVVPITNSVDALLERRR